MTTRIGTKRVCRCGRVIVAVKDRTVISLTAGVWVHATVAGRMLCRYAAPEDED